MTPERRKQIQKKHRNTPAAKQKAKELILRNYERYLLNSVRRRAREKDFEINLEISDIVIPELCPYLQIPLTRIRGQGHVATNPSIDRIDSSRGYVKGNIEVISYLANSMKQNATKAQLITFAKSILNKFEKEKS